jgi:hypothetical protein
MQAKTTCRQYQISNYYKLYNLRNYKQNKLDCAGKQKKYFLRVGRANVF